MSQNGKNKGFAALGLRGLSGPAGGADFGRFCTQKRVFSTELAARATRAQQLISRQRQPCDEGRCPVVRRRWLAMSSVAPGLAWKQHGEESMVDARVGMASHRQVLTT